MEWSLADFFADGGTTTFVDRLTGALGIHASQVKIVSVYEGSLIVNYDIEAGDDESLSDLQDIQNAMFESGDFDLGAPVLDFATSIVSSETSDEYEPTTIEVPEFTEDKLDYNEFDSGIGFIKEENISYKNVTI